MGRIDETGHVILKGRIQEKIKKRGYSLYPRDLEWALQYQNPAVTETFVMGVQTDNVSDKLVYFVVTTMTEDEIKAYCREHMQPAWQPDRIIILEAIPRTRSGKPILAQLKALL
jgi:long-chain acyl-CoA synthetase